MTASVQPKGTPFLTVSDTNTRLEQYLNAFQFYLRQEKIEKIVFCDNTEFAYDYSCIHELADKEKKQVEILCFQGDVLGVKNKGKGYGEGEIIKYVLENSELMRGEDFFAKVTGRYVIENVNQIMTKLCVDYNYFNFCGGIPAINTAFFALKRKDYEKYLMDCYKHVDDANKKSLERVFYKTLVGEEMKYRCMPRYPRVQGISGTSGANLRENFIKFKIKDILCRLQKYNDVMEKGFKE